MHLKNRTSKIRCCPCLGIIAANETVFVSAFFFFAAQSPLIAGFASEASDRQGYPVFAVDSPFHLSLDPLFL